MIHLHAVNALFGRDIKIHKRRGKSTLRREQEHTSSPASHDDREFLSGPSRTVFSGKPVTISVRHLKHFCHANERQAFYLLIYFQKNNRKFKY